VGPTSFLSTSYGEGGLYPGVKRPGREADHFLLEVKYGEAIFLLAVRLDAMLA
jgi:hypothetical protein